MDKNDKVHLMAAIMAAGIASARPDKPSPNTVLYLFRDICEQLMAEGLGEPLEAETSEDEPPEEDEPAGYLR